MAYLGRSFGFDLRGAEKRTVMLQSLLLAAVMKHQRSVLYYVQATDPELWGKLCRGGH